MSEQGLVGTDLMACGCNEAGGGLERFLLQEDWPNSVLRRLGEVVGDSVDAIGVKHLFGQRPAGWSCGMVVGLWV